MKRVRRFIALSIFLSSGCTTVGLTQIDYAMDEKPEDCQPTFFENMEQVSKLVQKDYEQVCTVASNIGLFDETKSPAKDAFERARKVICTCGADAVVPVNTRTTIFRKRFEYRGIHFTGKKKGGAPFSKGLEYFSCQDKERVWKNGKCTDEKFVKPRKFGPRARPKDMKSKK